MGMVFVVTLEGKIYSCKHCGTHLALSEDIISKSFQCKHGKAYLFSKAQVFLDFGCRCYQTSELVVFLDLINFKVNVTLGEKIERMMMTGVHVVADIFCVRCGSIVGWKYEMAHEKNQKYKEGKSVLERFKISGPDGSHYCVSHEAYAGVSDADDV